jgi:uncharacterized membrane protein YgcG
MVSVLAHAIPIKDVPNPWVARGVWVEDQGQVLGADYGALITTISQQLKDKTTTELMVVTVDNLDGLTVEDYAEQLFKQLGVGQRDKDNGVLILLSRDDRKVRIEVGYGVESILNDAKAGRLLDEHAVPHLKDNQFGRGVYEVAKATAAVLAEAAPAETSPLLAGVVDKRVLPFIMGFMSMVVLMSVMIAAKSISYVRRKTVQGRKEALTSISGLSFAPFVLPPLGAIMVGYSEGVFLWGIAAAVVPAMVSVGVWFALQWFGRRVTRWHPHCPTCKKPMAFVQATTSSASEADSGRVLKGAATDLWRCSACGAEQAFSDVIYKSARSGSSRGWSYSRPGSGGRSSGGGSSGGGGASRGF